MARKSASSDTTSPTGKATARPRRTNAERAATTRQRILEATIRCLHTRGYGSVTNIRVAAAAGISRGAMMHHFPTRAALLAATTEYCSTQQIAHRIKRLEALEPGLPRFRALIDLAWETARQPEGLALNEIRIGCRGEPGVAKAVTLTMSRGADAYGRFIGTIVRQAGLTPDKEMQGLSATVAMACRSMAIDRFTHPSPEMVENVLGSLRCHREEIIARQLGRAAAIDPARTVFDPPRAEHAVPTGLRGVVVDEVEAASR